MIYTPIFYVSDIDILAFLGTQLTFKRNVFPVVSFTNDSATVLAMVSDAVKYVLIASIAFIFFYTYRQHKTRSTVPLPPGPRRLPLIGNIHNKPAKFEWETYAEWSAKYGELDLNLPECC